MKNGKNETNRIEINKKKGCNNLLYIFWYAKYSVNL